MTNTTNTCSIEIQAASGSATHIVARALVGGAVICQTRMFPLGQEQQARERAAWMAEGMGYQAA